MTSPSDLPEWQHTILDKGFHPTGRWAEFPLSETESTVAQRFAVVAAANPDRPAIIGPERSISYAELRQQAQAIACGLAALCDGKRLSPIALLVENDEEAIVAIWGALVGGIPFAVLESSWPEAYLQTVLNSLSPTTILTNRKHLARGCGSAPAGATLHDWHALRGCAKAQPVTPQTRADTWACIQYTSGSTGEPKGLVTTQRGILFAAASLINSMHITPEDRLLLANPPGYGGHLSVVAGAFCAGAAVCLYNPKVNGVARLDKWLHDSQVTIWTSTPPLFREFARTASQAAPFPHVRFVRLHGDRTLRSDFDAYCAHLPDRCLFRNDLGMTELARVSQFIADKETRIESPVVPVGYPYPGVEYWIENEAGERARMGEEGDLVLRSRYLSPGYFVGSTRPLQRLTGDVLPDDSLPPPFRTGDRGMMDEQGCLHLLGRSNSEVKVRGYRVSLSLIERKIVEHSQVQNALALVERHPTGEDELLVIVEAKAQTSPRLLRSHLLKSLSGHLPSHLLPDRVLFVDGLPLNANGKVSVSEALKQRDGWRSAEALSQPPRTRIEQMIADCWCAVLGLPQVGIHDPFLELGGNSLQAMRIAARVQAELGVEIPLTELFAAATVAEMGLVMTATLLNHTQVKSSESNE